MLPMQEEWNNRYSVPDFIYGTEPNAFFREQLLDLTPGNALFPAEGEGRNAVYAATQGWNCTAFDFSQVAREKALRLAESRSCQIEYFCQGLSDFEPGIEHFDLLALFYTHFPQEVRSLEFPKLLKGLKAGGMILLEVFHKEQLPRTTGGPKIEALLYSENEIPALFPGTEILLLEKKLVILNEGDYHQGEAVVVRLKARKH